MPEKFVNNTEVSWKTVKNTVSERMINNSLIHTFHDKKIRKRTKFLNNELKKHSHFKSYSHYVEIKTAILKKLPKDDESDFETSFKTNNTPSKSSVFSSDDEYEGNHQDEIPTTYNHSARVSDNEVEDSDKKTNSIKSSRKKSLGLKLYIFSRFLLFN